MTYQVDTTDFTPVLLPIIQTAPDLLVLSGVSPANAPQLIRSARELGYTGLISTEMAPFGGFKQSGLGRDNGRMATEEYTEMKSIVMRAGPRHSRYVNSK